jgi:rhodanese-related sulfurtransferase
MSLDRPAALRCWWGVCAALVGILATLLLLAACGETQDSPSPSSTRSLPTAYTDIGPDELADMLKQKDFLLINTHVPYAGEIEQTDLFLPFDRAAELVDRLPADKAARIVVYCRSDRMSRIAVEEWVKAGYTNLYNLHGGFEAWEAAGFPLLHLNRE